MKAIQSLSNFGANSQHFAKGVKNMVGGTAKGQNVSQGMEALLGGFVLVIVAIYLVVEGRQELNASSSDLESVDIALFGVVFIVLIAGIALWAWSKIT